MPPGCGGASRPEKRVTARSKLPQKKCTGLDLPRKPVRNSLNTRSACTSARQNRCTAAEDVKFSREGPLGRWRPCEGDHYFSRPSSVSIMLTLVHARLLLIALA